LSPDGEEGYPGNLSVTLSYSLNSNNQLCIQYEAETDQPTPVNLTSHLYFNLSGFEHPTIHDHLLQIFAEGFLEKNRQNTPTGKVLPVAGMPQDFRMEKRIGHDISSLQEDGGYDHHFVLSDAAQTIPLAAVLKDPSSGRILRVCTTEPGMQVYTANYFDGTISGQHNAPYQQHGAVALETQHCPDSPNQKGFPDITLHPGKKYTSTTIYEFSIS
jgi:aldose 1-epimerase